VAAVQATPEHLVRYYGTVSGKREQRHQGVYHIEKILEKPSLSRAELELHVPGLRMGYYLCFFGMHVLTHNVFHILEEKFRSSAREEGEYQLTPALQDLALREKYLALELKGSRYDIGARFGLVKAQLALSLAGQDRDQILTELVELLVETNRRKMEDKGK
jgi:UTP--glucose-1-phosphate uridylyltransferase